MTICSNIKNFSLESLRAKLVSMELSRYRADQVFLWLYRRGVERFEEMTDLGVDLRGQLAEAFTTEALVCKEVLRSDDGTIKAVLQAQDGARIEAVLIPESERTTLCVSTQVGCPLECDFCATGKMGFLRNLTTAEIIDQVFRMRALLADERQITNLVFMGMGEPLLNLPNVIEAIRILLDPKGFGYGPRRITVSTSGVVPKIRELLDAVPVNLAVSLHATRDAVRDVLVPLNRRFPLAVLIGELRSLDRHGLVSKRHPVFFEYTLLAGVNDSEADARELLHLLRGIPAKINVIPVNPHLGSAYCPPSDEVIHKFMGVLARARMPVTLRRSRGADIAAACGQLAQEEGRHSQKEAGETVKLAMGAVDAEAMTHRMNPK